MQLSINEMNEILYCIGKEISNDDKSPELVREFRQTLFNKLYTELEQAVNEDMKSQGFYPASELGFDEDDIAYARESSDEEEPPYIIDESQYEWADWECSEGTLHGCNEECDCPDSSKYYESLGIE